MRVRRCVAAAILASVLGVAASASASSWIGDRSAWRYAYGRLQSTVDGGRHWSTMIDSNASRHRDDVYFDVVEWAHVLPRGGFALVGRDNGIDRELRLYWTVDDGKRWYHWSFDGALPTDPSDFESGPSTAYLQMEGHGRYVFFATTSIDDSGPDPGPTSTDISELLEWPPAPTTLRCARFVGREDIGIRGHVCERAAQLRDVSIAHFEDGGGGLTTPLVNIPGGIAALYQTSDPAHPPIRLVLRRYGKTRVIPLPIDDSQADAARSLSPSLRIDWPEIEVEGTLASDKTVNWISHNGGSTWTVSWPTG